MLRANRFLLRARALSSFSRFPKPKVPSLYDKSLEKDSCGVGLLANLHKKPSRKVVVQANEMLVRMSHRGGCGCDPASGDGAGILVGMPHEFMTKLVNEGAFGHQPLELTPGRYAVGNVFFRKDRDIEASKREFNALAEELNLTSVGWRTVPTSNAMLGESSKASEPHIEQVLVIPPNHMSTEEFEKELLRLRVVGTKRNEASEMYICSLSNQTITYKGQLTPAQLLPYYEDLQTEDFTSHVAMVHSRFSTNTFPSWDRAQPNRVMCHNGEINTLRGNKNWMFARGSKAQNKYFGQATASLLPVCSDNMSDSGNFDSALELLSKASTCNRTLPETMMMMIPEAWQNNKAISPEKKAMYQYNACLMEPWDGPAMIAFCDGKSVGASLDRNGLRPSRYYVTKDGHVALSSEVGVLEGLSDSEIVAKHRLEPGKMFYVDFNEGRIISDEEIKNKVASSRPFAKWVEENMVTLPSLPTKDAFKPIRVSKDVTSRLNMFGFTTETMEMLLVPMGLHHKEPLGSMGNDAPLAVLSEHPKSPSEYFKQLFAQVTNPPIDPIREELVMSLQCPVGPEENILDATPGHASRMIVEHPVLTLEDVHKLKTTTNPKWAATTLDATFPVNSGPAGLQEALDRLCEDATTAVAQGKSVLLFSDLRAGEGRLPVPSLLVVGAVHQHLLQTQQRTSVALFVEAGDAKEVHDFATLLGFGADGVCPHMAYEALAHMKEDGLLKAYAKRDISNEELQLNYQTAIGKGLLKVMSKMGISTLQSYKGAQVFEAVGLGQDVISRCFKGTTSRLQGSDMATLYHDVAKLHKVAYPDQPKESNLIRNPGMYHARENGEVHFNTPKAIVSLQTAARQNSREAYLEYRDATVAASRKVTLRGLLEFNTVPEDERPSLSEMEPISEIVKRFNTGAMSLGSISQETHEALAIAMNQLGGRSNTGEGGEDPSRYALENGKPNRKRSAIKQVASGRFGVTMDYLTNADQLQIKMAQGAKPGEGGELPGHKVSDYIAARRHTTPGVGLISPPPHHDIYSIEDLAQLIHDLKNANPVAEISVKLVSEVGVGVVAAGVAKAKAEHITISGHDGGTGASSWTGVKHGGLPWELGLAEAQQTLVLNNLRSRVKLQTDGQLKTGRDVVIAALLGAEEYGFATAPLIALGCIMMRKCHLNTCPVGVATQDPELRKKFAGTPEHVVNFLWLLAEEVQDIVRSLGAKSLDEVIGRADLLRVDQSALHDKTALLDFAPLLVNAQALNPSSDIRYNPAHQQDHGLDTILDQKLLDACKDAIEFESPVEVDMGISNVNRTVGAMLSHKITAKYGAKGLPKDTIALNLTGHAGQSLAFGLAPGIRLTVKGDANDYVGKALSGGTVVVSPSEESLHGQTIVGNAVLYGGTSGSAFFAGRAGERFAVRNSGVDAVVEGVGDHGCEYMTGGHVVVLGSTGRNFGAGMSGGIAYIYDPNNEFAPKCNTSMVNLESMELEDETRVHELIAQHASYTESPTAKAILANWEGTKHAFVKVMPEDYKRVLEASRPTEQVHVDSSTGNMSVVHPAPNLSDVVAKVASVHRAPPHPLRRLCFRLVRSKWFSRASVLVVLVNTIILGLVDYSNPWATGPNMLLPMNQLIEKTNNVSVIIFTIEAFIKIIAEGFVVYIEDNWNKLDSVVIISGIIAWASGGRSAVGQLRILRVLRPLRTLRSFPGLRILVNGVLASLPPLLNAGLLLGFSYLTLAILGMELWQDKYHGRCRLTPFPVQLNFNPLNTPSIESYPNTTWTNIVTANPTAYRCTDWSNNDIWRVPQPCFWPLDPSDTLGQYCGSRQCPTPNTTCGSNYDKNGNPRFLNLFANGSLLFDLMGEPDFTANLNFGLTTFDNIWSTLIIVLQIVTASGWMVLTENTQDAYSWVVAGVYFNAFLFIGMCFLLQLFMAVLYSEFEKAKEVQERQMTQRHLNIHKAIPNKSVNSITLHNVERKMTEAQTPTYRYTNYLRFRIMQLVISPYFRQFGLFTTTVNVIVLSCISSDMTEEATFCIETINFFCLAYFGLEMILKMTASGLSLYFRQPSTIESIRDGFNRFDCITFIIGIVDTLHNPPEIIDGNPGRVSPFSALRALRAIKIAQSFKSLNRLLLAIMEASGEILNFMVFLILFVYIYALLGMELFATKLQFDSNNRPLPFNGTNPIYQSRPNFDTIDWAMLSVFQMMTYDNWPSVLYNGWLAIGWLGALYHCSIIVLGVWIVMNVFSAILVESVMTDSDDEDEDSKAHFEALGRMYSTQRRSFRRLCRKVLITVHLDMIAPAPSGSDSSAGPPIQAVKVNTNSLRRKVQQCLEHKNWERFVTLIVFLSCVLTALDSPLLDTTQGLGYFIDKANMVFAVLFTAEMTAHFIAYGIWAYICDPWKCLDGFIVVVSLLSWSLDNTVVASLRPLRSLRALRPLRVINKLPQLKVVVNTLFRCTPEMFKAFIFFLFILLIFGIMCVMFFRGSLSTCSLSPYTYLSAPRPPPWFPQDYAGSYNSSDLAFWDVMSYPRPWNELPEASQAILAPLWPTLCNGANSCSVDGVPTSKTICLAFNQTWERRVPQRFDNIFLAMGSLYELTTLEGWIAVAIACIDAVGPDMQPIRNTTPSMMYFWMFFIICGAFFMTNLFIGVLCDSFIRENYGVLVTDEQISWIKMQQRVLAMKPHIVLPPPSNPLRSIAFRIVNMKYFDISIMACIIVNMLCMAITYYGQSELMTKILNDLNYIFAGVFTLECGLKLLAHGPHNYFRDEWNRFDFAIVVLTAVSIIVPLVLDSNTLGPIATVMRVFRVGRALRLINHAKLIKAMFDTILISLPAAANVTSLLMLMYYIFAAVGVQLFAKVGFGAMLNSHQNFQTFWIALQTLIGFSTGENWDNFLWEIYYHVPTTNPQCIEPVYNESVCGFNTADSCIPLDGCGSVLILPYMYIFFFIMGYVGINIFSGIVVDAIGDASNTAMISSEDLENFTFVWSKYDPTGTGLITVDNLCHVLLQLNPPFGLKSTAHATMQKAMQRLRNLHIDIYDKQFVHFKDVPRALVLQVVSSGDQKKMKECAQIMEDMGVAKAFDDAWYRHCDKTKLEALKAFDTSKASYHFATEMIARKILEHIKAKRALREYGAMQAKYPSDEEHNNELRPPNSSYKRQKPHQSKKNRKSTKTN